MGLTFLRETETLTKHRDRLSYEPVHIPQALRINSLDLPKRHIICRLNRSVACANADSGSDLDLVSPQFAKSRSLKFVSGVEEIMFADGSFGYTSGVAQASFSVGMLKEDEMDGFIANSDTIDLEFHVLESLTSDVLVGQDTIQDLQIFADHEASFIPSISAGQSSMNIIRHIRSVHRSFSVKGASMKRWLQDKLGRKPDEGSSAEIESSQKYKYDDGQRENARHSAELERIKTMGDTVEALEALQTETFRFQGHKEPDLTDASDLAEGPVGSPRLRNPDERTEDHESEHDNSISTPRSPRFGEFLREFTPSPQPPSMPLPLPLPRTPLRSPPPSFPSLIVKTLSRPQTPLTLPYQCDFPGCTSAPFQTRYLLK
ncbi:MAG: hypothetical protein M1820_008382 [Bogoriella megaspora]|nr:MAG: hypothetical protein M1820_008382 [Bogoriella megaspora]